MRFELTSSQECLIDGVGHLIPGESVVVDEFAFRLAHGYPISKANFPDYVTVLALTDEPADEEEPSETEEESSDIEIDEESEGGD